MAINTRTMAFQISEDLFQRIRAHLERETTRTGRKLAQENICQGGFHPKLRQTRP